MEADTLEGLDVSRCTDPSEWDAFVERNGGPVFARWGWGDAVEYYGHDRWYLVAREGGAIVGALPLFHVQSRLFGNELVSVPFASRGSLVLGDTRPDAARDLLLERARELADELQVDVVSLRGRELGGAPSYSNRRRWVTFEVPVADGPGAAWDALDSSRRGHVRKGRKNDLDVRLGTDIEDLREYYRLYLQSMRGHGSPPHSFEFYRRLWNRFHADGTMRLYLVEHDGAVINGGIYFAFGDRVYAWGGVSDYEYRDLDGGSLLEWRGIEWSAENDFEVFDFGRTREGSGVYMYKKSFGGEKVWLDDYHYFPAGEAELPHPEREKYEPIKRVWRRLPLSVTRIVGPRLRGKISL